MAAQGRVGVASAGRLPFLDRLRGLAAAVMLEVHVVNALLAPDRRRGLPFACLNFLNGLVAPAFLFCAGFALAHSLRRSFQEPEGTDWTKVLLRGVRKGAGLLALGYVLHGLGFVWHGFSDPRAWREFLQADILQIIALSLTVLFVLAFLVRRADRFAWSAFLSGAAVLLVTPWARALDTSAWPAWAQPYFNDRVVSEFPLFPWAAFALLGAAVGARPSDEWGKKLLRIAALAAAAAGLLWILSSRIFPAHDPWSAGPPYLLARLAVLCLLGAALSLSPAAPPGSRLFKQGLDAVLGRFSRHSLLVYVVHIPLVYGGYGFSLRASVGATQGYLGCALWSLALAALMYALAAAADRKH